MGAVCMEKTVEKKRKVVGFYHYGVILTYLSVVAAIVGICFSVGGNKGPLPYVGVICLLISGICDSFDGAVARTRKNRNLYFDFTEVWCWVFSLLLEQKIVLILLTSN